MRLAARYRTGWLALLAVVGMIAALASAVPAASAATTGAPAAASLASSYTMTFDNLTYSETADGSLDNIAVDASGNVTGNMTVDPPLGGTGPLTGTLSGGTFTFTVGSGDYTGTVDAATLAISGTYDYPGQNGDWTATPVAAQPGPCTSDYRTTVTERAGTNNDRELYTDTITFSWCAGAGGQVQITSASQVPDVKKPGWGSISGLHYKLLKLAGITFWATPATAPVPTVSNGPASASVTASGLTYNQEFDLGSDLADLLVGALTDGLARPLVPLIRSGELGALSIKLLHDWGKIVAWFDSFAAKHFGLPNWASSYLANLPIGQIKSTVASLTGSFVSTLSQSLAALGHNATLASVISTLQSGIQQISSALDFITPLWQPLITVTVTSSPPPSVSDEGTQTAFGVWVEDPPSVKTTPAS